MPLLVHLGCAADPEDKNGDGVADGVFTPNNVTVVAPINPHGFAAGEVLTMPDNRPLSGARVSVFGGGIQEEASTDSSGRFQVGPISAGASFSIAISAGGFADATLPGLVINDSAGNFPVGNGGISVGRIFLLPTNFQYSVQVVSSEGVAVPGAAVTVETVARFFVEGQARATSHAVATTNAEGFARVEGLPDVRSIPPSMAASSALIVSVGPADLTGDQIPDLQGRTRVISEVEVREGTRPPIIVLTQADNQRLEVVASNIPRLTAIPMGRGPGVLASDETIRLVYSLPIDRDTVLVDLRDERGATSIATTRSSARSGIFC